MRPPFRVVLTGMLMILCIGRLQSKSAHAQSSSVIREMAMQATSIAYDPVSDKLFAALSSTHPTHPNSIQVINPTAATVEATIPVESDPEQMEITDDGRYLYVSVLNESAIQRIDLATRTAVATFPLTADSGGALKLWDFDTVPGSPNKVVAAQQGKYGRPQAVVYDNGVRLPSAITEMTSVEVAEGPRVYGNSSGHFYRADIDASGLVNMTYIHEVMTGEEIVYDGGRVYSRSGEVLDPEKWEMLGTYMLPDQLRGIGLFVPLSRINRMFIHHSQSQTLLVYNQQTFQLIGQMPAPHGVAMFGPRRMVAIGGHSLALMSPDQIFFYDYSEFVTRPAYLEANAGGSTTINLLWLDAALDEAGFRVERAPISNEAWQHIGNTQAATFADMTAACGTVYRYRVSAYWADGRTSEPSNIAQGQTNPCAAPPPAMIRFVPIKGYDMVYDPVSRMLYVGVPGSVREAASNSIRAIDPVTGNFGAVAYIGSYPEHLALSDDGQYLYAFLNGASAFRALHLPTMTAQNQVSLGNGCYGPCYAHDIAVMPGNSQVVAVTKNNVQHDDDVSLYENGVLKSSTAVNAWEPTDLDFGSSSRLYGYTSGVFSAFSIASNSFTGVTETGNLIPNSQAQIKYIDGLVYASNGVVIDPIQLRIVARTSDLNGTTVESVSDWNRTFIYSEFYLNRIFVYDPDTFDKLGYIEIPEFNNGYGYNLVRTGDHLALLTADGVYLIDLSLYIDPPLTLEVAPISANRIDLNWTQSGVDTDGIRVERSTHWENGYQEIGTSPGKFYTDTGLACGTTYYYRIRAYRQQDGVVSTYGPGASTTTLPCAQNTPIPITATPIPATAIPLPATATPINATATNSPTALGAGYHEDDHPSIIYTTQWTTVNSTRASGGGYRYSYRDDAMIRFYYTGSTVTLIRQTGSNRGEMQVCIDGSCQIVNNYSGSTLWQQPVSFPKSYGDHIVEIRSADGATLDLDAIRIEAGGQASLPTASPTVDPSGALGVGTYEQTHPTIRYTGTWSSLNTSRASGGSYTYSWRQDAAIAFSFTGSAVTLIRRLDSNRGEIQICIDGACQTITNYAESVQWQQPISFSVSQGTHTVEIRNTGGKTIDLDAIRVESTSLSAEPSGAPPVALLALALLGALLLGGRIFWNQR